MPCKEEEEKISTDYDNMFPMTIGINNILIDLEASGGENGA